MSLSRFLLGVGIGMCVGVLLAPAPGEETRQKIASRARDLMEIPERKMEEKAAEVAESAKEKAGDIGGEVGRKAAEAAVEAVSDNLREKNKSA